VDEVGRFRRIRSRVALINGVAALAAIMLIFAVYYHVL
jgi:hypothetical protein